MTEERRIFRKESQLKIACCQINPKIGDKPGNLQSTLDWINYSVDERGELIILPELCTSGYVFNSREEAYSLAESIPKGESIKVWEKAAKKHNIHLIAGHAEEDGSRLFNTAVLIGPDGYNGKYRKLHLCYEENLFFEESGSGLPLFYIPWGRIGMMVCYDMWFPEVARIYAIREADILVIPTNWPEPKGGEGIPDITDKILISQAHLNGVYIAACNRIGSERGVTFKGRSIIANPEGKVKAGPGSREDEELIMANCNLSDSRNKRKSKYNDTMNDRRVDVYQLNLAYSEK